MLTTLLIDNTLLEKKTKHNCPPKKDLFFQFKMGAAELPLFVSIISDDQVGFSFHQ